MKKIFIIFICIYIALCKVHAADNEVIDLHKTKSLDQLVLENENINEIEDTNSEEIILENNDNQNVESDLEIIDLEVETINSNSFFDDNKLENLKKIFNNITEINSNVLNSEFNDLLLKINLDYDLKKNRDIFFIIVERFYNNGEISKAFNLIQSRNIQNEENLDFYKKIELDYLFATFQLERACNLIKTFDNNLTFSFNYLEKIDIFCLILEDKLIEAELQNSILIETESMVDEEFQKLYKVFLGIDNEIKIGNINNKQSKYLIFLYSAMFRIAEIPLNEEFLSIDSKNLAIPVILNNLSDISLRIKAAHQAYRDELISVDSISALYQSVDFSPGQLNDPDQTLVKLGSKNEMIMAFYYQLINIQIFPSERIKVIIDYWDFAKNIDLEQIAYSSTSKIISSIEPSSENYQYASHIATSYIYNLNLEKASEWIAHSENYNEDNNETKRTKFLYDLYNSADSKNLLELIKNNNLNLSNSENSQSDLMYLLSDIFDNEKQTPIILENIDFKDNRAIPSTFLIALINESIEFNRNYDFLFYVLVSMDKKQWFELHPEHLRIILNGFKSYENNEILRSIIIEVIKNYKII